MIKFKLALIGILFSGITLAQSVPQGINYQAVALDQSGQPIPGVDIVGRPIDGAEIGVRISILENSAGGPVLYQEDHEVRTDLYGMFNLVIGEGLQLSVGSFPSIDWKGDKYLKVELSVDNDGDFKVSAIQQLMSVPYAFLAENAITAETALDVDDADADPQNEIQSISLRGDTILLSNGGFVVLPPDQVNDADADPLNEIQALSLSNDTVYLSNGGFVVLPTDKINDADADPLNEIQTLSKVGDTISLSGGGSVQVFDGDYSNLNNTPSIPSKTSDLINDSGYLTTEIDGSVTNEIQVLSISNDTIFLSDGGFVVLPAGFDGDYNSLVNTPSIPSKTSDLVNDSGYLNAEIDGSITNELQTLSLSSDTLYLSDGGKVPTSSLGPEYTILSATTGLGTGWYISLEKDGVPQSDFFRVNAGNGISLSGNNSTDYTITNLSNDMDSTNELQTLSMSGDTLFLSNGGFVVLPSGFDGSYSSLTGAPIIPTSTSDLVNDSGYLTTEQDGSTTNELQNISKTGNTITLSNNGGSVTVFDGDYNDLSNAPALPTKTSDLTNDSGFITTEQDGSTTNELQTLSISNDTLFLSNGGFVKLPMGLGQNNSSTTQYEFSNNQPDFILADNSYYPNAYPGAYNFNATNDYSRYDTLKLKDDSIAVDISFYFSKSFSNNVKPILTSTLFNDALEVLDKYSSNIMSGGQTSVPQYFNLTAKSAGEYLIVKHTLSNIGNSWSLYLSQPKVKAIHFSNNTSTNNATGSKSLTNESLDELFGLCYTGDGSLGSFNSGNSQIPTGRFLNYKNFMLSAGDTFNLPATTTVLFVQDTCYLAGVIWGQQAGNSNRNLTYNTSSSLQTTYNGLQASSGTNNTTSNYSGIPKKFNEGRHKVLWNEWALFNYLSPYQEWCGGLSNDEAFIVCSSQYGEISGQDGGTGGSAYSAYGGKGGKGLIIITKTLIINNAIFDLRGTSGTKSPNTSFAGGAGGGGSLFISYENGEINNPIIIQSGGSSIPVGTTTPLTDGSSGRHLFYKR